MKNGFENEPAPDKNRETNVIRFVKSLSSIYHSILHTDSNKKVRVAEALEARVLEYADDDFRGKGRTLLRAGMIYIRANRYSIGQETLESALPPLRQYAEDKTLDSFVCLIKGLEEVRDIYKWSGYDSKTKQAEIELEAVTAEMESVHGPRDSLLNYNDLYSDLGI